MLSPRTSFHKEFIDNTWDLSPKDFADLIDNSLIESMKAYNPLDTSNVFLLDEIHEYPNLNTNLADTDSVLKKLKNLNPSKAPGPGSISNWILREYAEVLTLPITHQLNTSYKEQKLPRVWKQADITPIPKKKPVSNISKNLRPISLIPALSKLAEDFVVEKHIAPAVLKIIDPSQFGGIPRSSATHALISMVHSWAEATDRTGSAVRVSLFDYRKAFDLIDYQILAKKVSLLSMPLFVERWVIAFLMNRQQRVKLTRDCLSEWADIPFGMPQETKLRSWLFLLMITDAVDSVQTWSTTNRLHVAKCC